MENKVKFTRSRMLLSGLAVLVLAGCATDTTYVNYTTQRFAPKDALYVVNVYPKSQALGAGRTYFVIGRVSIEGFASDGVNPGSLTNQAKAIARKRGADAVINARTTEFRYFYGDVLLRFNGELIVYAPAAVKS